MTEDEVVALYHEKKEKWLERGYAFVVHKGERLRVDISSSAHPFYVRHTNNRGLFSEQTTAKVADNTVILDKSTLTVYTE